MTPSATSTPTQTTKAWASAFRYVLEKGWLTQKQITHALEFGWASANREAKS